MLVRTARERLHLSARDLAARSGLSPSTVTRIERGEVNPDRTIHRYPEVDLDVLWDTLLHDLPELGRRIRTHLDCASD